MMVPSGKRPRQPSSGNAGPAREARSRRFAVWIGLSLLLLGGVALGLAASGGSESLHPPAGLMEAHGQGKPEPRESPVPKEPSSPEAILLVSAHTAGWITPCGCAGSQAGGVARRAGYGELLRKTFPDVPVYYFDLGGFLMYGSKVQKATSEAVVESMNRIGYEGINVAFQDLGVTSEEARFLDTSLKIPRFSANLSFQDTGSLAFAPYRIVTARAMTDPEHPQAETKALKIGVIGLVDDQRPIFAFGSGGRSIVVSPMGPALARYVPELRSKVDLVVLLAEVNPSRLWEIADALKGVDMAVAGQGTQFFTEPVQIATVPTVAVGNQGKYLAELRVHRSDGKPEITPFVHWLDERFPENPDLAKMTEQRIDVINEMSRLDLADMDQAPADVIAPFVGAEACASCHQKSMEIWKSSKHAHAFQTLVDLKRDYTVACVYCHVTGTGAEVGGFMNAKATPQLSNVQCEQCHGPAQSHLADTSAPYGTVPEKMCERCHTPATDPHFDKAARWKVIAH